MAIHRLKHSFTAGELHPLMDARVDFARYNNGCKILLNMQSTVQGPVTRRNGFKFIYDLTSLGLDIADPRVRIIPFVFNELQAYTLIFFMHTDGDTRMVIATQEGLVVHPDPVDTYCPPDPYTFHPGCQLSGLARQRCYADFTCDCAGNRATDRRRRN